MKYQTEFKEIGVPRNNPEYMKLWYLKNRLIALQKQKQYHQQNRSERLEYNRKYYHLNKRKLIIKNKEYSNLHKDKRKVAAKKHYLKNKSKYIKRGLKYTNNKYRIDSQFNAKTRLRSLLGKSLKLYGSGKIKPSKKYGIDYVKIIEHLKPFPEDISKYHIDHIRPLCSFDLTNPEEVKKAFAPENHQWLLAKDNLVKGAKYD